MHKKILSILMITIFFIGCSQKLNEHAKPTDILHEQALTQTQKTILKEGLITKVFFVTTFINHIDTDLIEADETLNQFIVSAYVPSGEDKKNYDNLIFKVNSKDPISVRELNDNDKLLELLPAPNPWSKYYIVQSLVDDTVKGISFKVGVEKIGLTKMEFHDRYGNLPSGRTMGFKNFI